MARGELTVEEETGLLSTSGMVSYITKDFGTPVLFHSKKRRKRLKCWDGVGEDGVEERAYWTESWKNSIRSFWPDCHTRTIIVPPITFNRVQYSDHTIGKDTIRIPKPDVQLSDVREDESRRRIHNAMCGGMFEGSSEGMVVRFGLSYDNYLNNARPTTGSRNKRRADEGLESRDVRSRPKTKLLCQQHHQCSVQSGQDSSNVVGTSNRWIELTSSDMFQCTACHPSNNHSREQSSQNGIKSLDDTGSTDGARRIPDLSKFPRPRDMEPKFQRGDIDLLMIHRQHGIIVVEVKTVGDVFGLSRMHRMLTDQLRLVRTRIRKAVAQLDKHLEVLNHILPDVHQEGIPITKGLALPNLDRQTVYFALRQDNDVTESLCKSFGVHDLNQALRRCLFSEDLPPIGHALDVKDDVTKNSLRAWWKSFANSSGPCMTNDLYEAVIAR